MILWKGHCSVHGRFTAEVVDERRVKDQQYATEPGRRRRRHVLLRFLTTCRCISSLRPLIRTYEPDRLSSTRIVRDGSGLAVPPCCRGASKAADHAAGATPQSGPGTL